MLNYFKGLSTHRGGWILLLISGLVLESVALFFQYGMNLSPCVMCVYERVALFGIILSAIVGLIEPKCFITRTLALIIGIISAVKGVLLSVKHVDYQLNPAPWNQCSYMAEFPQVLPLDKWFPLIFKPYGICSEISWTFLGFSMPQWLIIVFTSYCLVFILLIISQFKHKK